MNKQVYQKRIDKLQGFMKEKNVDICLLMDRENLIYFAGIEQVECMTVIVPKEGMPVGVTLWIDLEFIKKRCLVEDIRGYVFPKQNLAGMVSEIIKKEMGYEDPIIAFERYFISFGYFDVLRKEFKTDNFVDFSTPIYMIRCIKEQFEIEYMNKAAQAVCKGMEAAVNVLKPGVKELDIVAEAEYAAIKAGSQGAPFRPQIVSGEKTLTTHPFSTIEEIKKDEVICINIGAKYNGYIAKMCRTAVVGDLHQEKINIFNAIKGTQEKVLQFLRAGVTSNDLAQKAVDSMKEYGYGNKFLNVIGYGVGLRQSEFYPVISVGNPTVIEENMIVDFLMPTVYDKQFGGARITDTIHVLKDGCNILTDYSHELIVK